MRWWQVPNQLKRLLCVLTETKVSTPVPFDDLVMLSALAFRDGKRPVMRAPRLGLHIPLAVYALENLAPSVPILLMFVASDV